MEEIIPPPVPSGMRRISEVLLDELKNMIGWSVKSLATGWKGTLTRIDTDGRFGEDDADITIRWDYDRHESYVWHSQCDCVAIETMFA